MQEELKKNEVENQKGKRTKEKYMKNFLKCKIKEKNGMNERVI